MEQVPNFLYIDADDKASSDRSNCDIGPAEARAVPLGSATTTRLVLKQLGGLLAQEETAGGGLSYGDRRGRASFVRPSIWRAFCYRK